jgi:hypothetical protein
VAAILVVAIAAIVILRRDSPPPAVVPQQSPTVQRAEKPAVSSGGTPAIRSGDAKESSARADLEKARTLARSRPEDLSAQLREYTDIVWKWEGTEAAREAAREGAAVKAAILEKVSAWMADLEAQIKGLLEAKQYAAAEQKVEELKKAHDLPEWRLAAEKRASEIFGMSKRAAEGEGGKKTDGSPDSKSPSKALSEEARGYLATWETAAARATARDFGGAISVLERSAPALREAEVKQELESDLVLFRKAAAVHQQAMGYLSQRPRGTAVTVAVRDGKGEVRRISGVVLQIDGERAELRSGKSSEFVEWADVTAATFAEIAQRGTFEPAVLAALCLLEGESEAARAFQVELPSKWSSYADGARAKLPKPDPAEKNARDQYAAAEKGFRSMDTLAAAVEEYKTLRSDFAATALVKRYSERIFRRSDAGREYYFAPADFRVEGTIQYAKSGKLESGKDSDDRDTLLNSAEIEFAVLPGLTYRCWLLVGACCEETFRFYYQGSELSETDAKTRKKLACEPGSTFAVSVKHSLRNLKKTHEEHKVKGAKVHPKTAARWEWIEIVLPKYAGPGAKKLKFMTNQAGFSIAGASISSSRKAPPTEAEIQDLEKQRTIEDPPMPVDPDLIGWWTFDEGAGDQVADLSGKNHRGKLVGSTQWADGKIGGGLQLAGGKSGVEVADAEDLRIAGDLTMAIWVKRTTESGDWVCILGRGTMNERNYGLWLEAGTRRWMYQQYGGAGPINVWGTKLIEQDQWIHLAVTIEGSLVRVYYNGQLDGQDHRPGPPQTRPAPLGIGLAIYHSGLVGVVDDARLYRRALSAEEIRGLYQGTR